jgi:DNA-binding MarR family transcriptional regulator
MNKIGYYYFHNENILFRKYMTIKADAANEIQIASIVHGFIDQWIKFEARLHKELAESHPIAEINLPGETNAGNDYSHFYRLSSIIYPRDRLTMKELSNTLSVPFSKATRLANWLVDNGLAKRMDDPSDRRVVLISLTAKGKELHRVIENYTRENVMQLFGSGLTPEEKMILLNLISKVIAALGNNSGDSH